MSQRESGLVYDWNLGGRRPHPRRSVEFDDETLRDGLQSPSVRSPRLADKLALLHAIAAIGITSADVGMPGAGERVAGEVEALCREIVRARLPIRPNCAARTLESDIAPVLAIQQRAGIPVEVALFAGSSPIRLSVEGWTLADVLRRAERAITLARDHGAPVLFVTEDTTRSRPEDLGALFLVAARSGASRVCIADTAGHATPLTVVRLVRFVRRTLAEAGFAEVGIDWHGHNDRGLAVANALTAAWAGAGRLHATALGVGERVGNPPMEQLLVNAALEGFASPRLEAVGAYVEQAARMLGMSIPPLAPVVGRDAFRTATGVHAAAILKARARGDDETVDLVYSAVPASRLGRAQEIEVGPMSGGANVRWWLAAHGYPLDAQLVSRILVAAKRMDRILTDDELNALVSGGAVD
ncbi:MAG: LeuA family protein [Acidobacteriota bacterium]